MMIIKLLQSFSCYLKQFKTYSLCVAKFFVPQQENDYNDKQRPQSNGAAEIVKTKKKRTD